MSHIISRPILRLKRPMPTWRKKCGLGITHMAMRKELAVRAMFVQGKGARVIIQ